MTGGTDLVQVTRLAIRDLPDVLALMRGLARFEGYLGEFAVTEADLAEELAKTERSFECHVARLHGRPVGIAVTYRVDWTFDLHPTLVMKELFVSPDARGLGTGKALFESVTEEARRIGASRVRWLVLADNARAKAFYRRMGAAPLPQWEQWETKVDRT